MNNHCERGGAIHSSGGDWHGSGIDYFRSKKTTKFYDGR